MSNTISGGINFSGIGSGTDFNAMIDQLKSVEQIPQKRMEAWKKDWQVRIDAFQEILDVISSAKTTLSKFSSLSTLLSKAVESSNAGVASATGDATIEENSYSINVKSLATSAVYSNKTPLDKNASINDTGETQHFNYTYKGKEMKYSVATGSTLEQLVSRINNDQANPGVKANLVKSGTGYILQMQGKDTGADASLSISSSLPAFNGNRSKFAGSTLGDAGKALLVPVHKEETYAYTYEGKEYTFKFNAGDSLETFVAKFNDPATNPDKPEGLKAKINQRAADDFGLEFTWTNAAGSEFDADMTNIKSSVPGLITGEKIFATATEMLNPKPQEEFHYTYKGTNHVLKFDSKSTPEAFVKAFNANKDNPGIVASLEPALTGDNTEMRLKFVDKTSKENVTKNGDMTIDAGTTVQKLKDYDYDQADSIYKKKDELGTQAGTTQYFQYSYKNETRILEIPPGTSLQDFVSKFNADKTNPGVNASLRKIDYEEDVTDPVTGAVTKEKKSKYALEMRDSTTKELVELDNVVSDIPGLENKPISFADKTEAVGAITPSKTFTYVYNNAQYTIEMEAGSTVKDFIEKLNNAEGIALDPTTGQPLKDASGNDIVAPRQIMARLEETVPAVPGNPGATPPVEPKPGSGQWSIKIYEADFTDPANPVPVPGGSEVALGKVTSDITQLSGLETLGDAWFGREPTDATFTLNGFEEQVLNSTTNTLTDVIKGMTITLKSVGETNLTVSTDSSELKTKVKEFVDSVNTIRSKIRELTKFDKNKSVKEPDKAVSQFDMQKGAVLTGNYGVQLLNTRLNNLMATSAKGFDVLNKIDSFATLGHIGISSVASESDPNAGLLTIDEKVLDEAIKKDPTGVAQLLAADKIGTSTGQHFTFAASGVTTNPGKYDVKYMVGEDGTLGDVYINGVQATTDTAFPGRYTVASYGNSAQGLAVQFNTLEGMEPGEYDGSVNIKQGKIPEMVATLEAEMRNVKGTEERGSIPVLIDNYNDIIRGIDKKIDRETERISRWEYNMKQQFSRLDALLGTYDKMMTTNASLLAQAGANG